MQDQTHQINNENKDILTTFLDEKKQRIHNAIEQAKSAKDQNKNHDYEFTVRGLVKLELKINEIKTKKELKCQHTSVKEIEYMTNM